MLTKMNKTCLTHKLIMFMVCFEYCYSTFRIQNWTGYNSETVLILLVEKLFLIFKLGWEGPDYDIKCLAQFGEYVDVIDFSRLSE